jgi:hypothetical protein
MQSHMEMMNGSGGHHMRMMPKAWGTARWIIQLRVAEAAHHRSNNAVISASGVRRAQEKC